MSNTLVILYIYDVLDLNTGSLTNNSQFLFHFCMQNITIFFKMYVQHHFDGLCSLFNKVCSSMTKVCSSVNCKKLLCSSVTFILVRKSIKN